MLAKELILLSFGVLIGKSNQLPTAKRAENTTIKYSGTFPNFFSNYHSPFSNAFPVIFPTQDLSPLTTKFNDPSLRNYPNPSLPSAAQPSLREKSDRLEVKFFKPENVIFDLFAPKNVIKRNVRFPETRQLDDFEQFEEVEDYDYDTGAGEIFTGFHSDDHRVPRQNRPVQVHNIRHGDKVINVHDVFKSPGLQPLPASHPSFALPLTKENPHFSLHSSDAVFPRPLLRRTIAEQSESLRPENFHFRHSEEFQSSAVDKEIVKNLRL